MKVPAQKFTDNSKDRTGDVQISDGQKSKMAVLRRIDPSLYQFFPIAVDHNPTRFHKIT